MDPRPLSQQWNLGIERAIRGDITYKPAGWPDDYVGNATYPLTRIMDDIKKGRTKVIESLGKVKPADLDVEVPTPRGGTRKREAMLMTLISEIPHHEGQIAYIRGAISRRRQTDTHFLT